MINKCYIVPVQNKCNCNCVFCISKDRNYNKDKQFLEINQNLKDNIKLLKNRNIKIFEITGGGEPLLHNNIQEIINIIKNEIPDCFIKIYTNANILIPLKNVDEINISIVHYNTDINNSFMKANNNLNIIDKIKYYKQNSNSIIRLSIPLIKGGIDSNEKLDTFINLTKQYVDSYIVRTLYEGTKDKDNLYIDIDYKNDLIKYERDNSVCNFDGLILWSDNNFYSDWSLLQKRYLKTFLLLKPDSQTYINEITKEIEDKGFKITNYYLLHNFKKQSLHFYKNKKLDYLKLIKKHLYFSSFLFGDIGLIIELDKDIPYNKLILETYNLKKDLRKKYSLTHNLNAYISNNNEISHLNLIHCPDPVPLLFDRDLDYISSLNLNPLNNNQINKIKKYRSFFI